MKPEDKELLFKDLSARLPYHVWCKIWLEDGTTEEGPLDLQHNYGNVLQDAFFYHIIKDIKPYLRPMSSITEEEIIDFLQIPDLSQVNKKFINDFKSGNFGIMANMSNYARNIDWLNKKMFDFRGLIPKGLAISTEEFNPYKN